MIGEYTGRFHVDDYLLLTSDGVTQAGMGHGFHLGIGSDGIAESISRSFRDGDDIKVLVEGLLQTCSDISGGKHEDDTSLALLHNRKPVELTLLTGPPSKKSMDAAYAGIITEAAGKTIVCGSTTMEIISRELGVPIEPLMGRGNPGMPPEYSIEGVDLATEGAITLNQVYNVLGEDLGFMLGDSSVKRMCMMLLEADIVHLHIGRAINDAHEDFFFKQVGVRVRRAVIGMIVEKLQKMGKLVIETYH